MLYKPNFSIQKRPLSNRIGNRWVVVVCSCLIETMTYAGTSFLNNNAVLSQATRAAVSANGDSHAIATADPNAASAVLDWTKFNVGSGQQMTFNGGGTTFFNLVDGAAGKSQIDGIINGTAGNVWVINPAGVAFSSTARIDIGGLFAAAAGNISNADALRAGTATLPEFSSFEGKVEVKGSQFTADQVALLGKSVAVEGNSVFRARATNMAAGGRLVVDEVGDGLVSINIDDFTEGTDDLISLHDVSVFGDLFVNARDDVQIGSMQVSGTQMLLESEQAGVVVEENAKVEVYNDGGWVNLISATGNGGHGDVTVDGDVEVHGEGNFTALVSDYGAGTSGGIHINGSVKTVGEGSQLSLLSGYSGNTFGDIEINGEVSTSDSTLYIQAGHGDLGDGSIKVEGVVSSGGNVQMYTTSKGSIEIGENAVVETVRGDSFVDIATGMSAWGTGDIRIDGAVVSAGDLYVVTGSNGGPSGNISIDGSVKSATRLCVYAKGESSDVQGNGLIDVSQGTLDMWSRNGDLNLSGIGIKARNADFTAANGIVDAYNIQNIFNGTVSAYGGTVAIAARNGLALGNVTALSGNLKAAVLAGRLTINKDASVRALSDNATLTLGTILCGSIDILGSVENRGVGGSVDVQAASLRLSESNNMRGDINVSGSVLGNSCVMFVTQDGDIVIGDKASIRNNASDTQVILISGTKEGGEGGDVIVNGSIQSADNDFSGMGGVYLGSGYGKNTSGDIVVNGTVLTEAALVMQAGRDSSNSGSIELNGDVGAMGNVALVAATGDVNISDGARLLKANGASGNLIISAADQGGEGNVNISGNVTARSYDDSGSLIVAGMGNGARGNVNLSGSIDVQGSIFVESPNGNICLSDSGTIRGEREAWAGIRLLADGPSGNGGKLDIHGTIATDDGQIVLTTGEMARTKDADVTVTGRVTAGGDDGSVLIYAGRTEGSTGGVNITGDIEGSASVDVRTGSGDVNVKPGGDLSAYADGGVVNIVSAEHAGARGNITLEGAVSAGQNVIAISGYGEGSHGDLKVDGAIVADRNDGGIFLMSGHEAGTTGNVVINGGVTAKSTVDVRTSDGNVNIGSGANVRATGQAGRIEVISGISPGSDCGIKIAGNLDSAGSDGQIALIAGWGSRASGNIDIEGSIKANASGGNVSIVSGYGDSAHGNISTAGEVCADDIISVRACNGSVDISGHIDSLGESGRVTIVANGEGPSGNVLFSGGRVSASKYVDIIADQNANTTDANLISFREGFANAESFPAVARADVVNFKIGGDVGNYGYLGVDGKVYGVINGNASIASAGSTDFQGGATSIAPTLEDIQFVATTVREKSIQGTSFSIPSIDGSPRQGVTCGEFTVTGFEIPALTVNGLKEDFSSMGDTSSLIVGRDLAVYTAGKIQANGLLVAGGDMTVSARSFGDVSYLRAGGKLTINNVGHPKYPRVAYFESLDGKEPKINNLPNDMVIFVDGRLAGGNINIMNMFGANEAFLVSTPELKSTQGIFGNPPFLHSDLDVANPMEVSAIDYLIQEVPRLTLSSEFPADVDQKVEANGLSLKDSYWFGQERVAKKPSEPTDGKVASAEE